jgi:hypothetical protein
MTGCVSGGKSGANFELPAAGDGLPGAGPITRGDWFQKIWRERRQSFAQTVRRDRGAVVFLGDSITHGWGDDLGGNFPTLKGANRGIGGDTSRGVLVRLREDVLVLRPRAVVLLIGTNDIEQGAAPETIAANIELRSPVTGQVTAHRAYSPSTGGFGPNVVPVQLVIDDEAVFIVYNDSVAAVGCLCRFDRPDLSFHWRYLTGAGAGVELYSVATDGGAVFVGTDTTGSTNPLRRVYRGNAPRTVVRRTAHALWAPYVYVSFGGSR